MNRKEGKCMCAKILVVDDEKPIADILKFNLEKEGYSVICAYDGDEAIKLAETENPDLILLDIMLPGKDGNEVCREVRKTQTMPIIKIGRASCRERVKNSARSIDMKRKNKGN